MNESAHQDEKFNRINDICKELEGLLVDVLMSSDPRDILEIEVCLIAFFNGEIDRVLNACVNVDTKPPAPTVISKLN